MPITTPEIDDERGPCGWGAPCEPRPTTVVRLDTENGCKMSVPSFVFGVWAVHRSVHVSGVITIPDPLLWCISHVPTGKSMAGFVGELDFWTAVRVARALEDSNPFPDDDLPSSDEDAAWIAYSVIGAALNDHYVWPLTAYVVLTSAAPSVGSDLRRIR
jgi:hypothetical protein